MDIVTKAISNMLLRDKAEQEGFYDGVGDVKKSLNDEDERRIREALKEQENAKNRGN